MTEGIIFDLRRYAIHDGPGIRTTVFFKGCPLCCQWCHNPESQNFDHELMLQTSLCIGCGLCLTACPHGLPAAGPLTARKEVGACRRCAVCAAACPSGARLRCGQRVAVAELLPILLRDRIFYDRSGGGVTISGGEPLAQPEFLFELMEQLQREEVHRCLDTSGHAAPDLMQRAVACTDLFLYDLKLMDSEAHLHYTGAGNELILGNLRLLAELGANVIVRVPVLPSINDSEENLKELGAFVSSLNRNWSIHLLPYHRLPESKYAALNRSYPLQTLEIPSAEVMLRVVEILCTYVDKVTY